MKVLICGGRDFADRELFNAEIAKLQEEEGITEVISGGARGADSMAMEWATKNHIPCHVFPADWNNLGIGAGPIRNQQMLREGKPDLVLAFPGGRGTADMMRRAGAAGVRVVKVVG